MNEITNERSAKKMEYKKRIRFSFFFVLALVGWMDVCVCVYFCTIFWVRQRRVPGCCLKHTISITARQPEGNFNFHLSDVQWCRCTSFRFHHPLILFHSFIHSFSHSVPLRFASVFDHSSHSFTSVFSVFTESWERERVHFRYAKHDDAIKKLLCCLRNIIVYAK